MEAAVGEPGYVEYEGGQARSSEILPRKASVLPIPSMEPTSSQLKAQELMMWVDASVKPTRHG